MKYNLNAADALAKPAQAVEHRCQHRHAGLLPLRLQDARLIDILHAQKLEIDAGHITDRRDRELEKLEDAGGELGLRLGLPFGALWRRPWHPWPST
jgi:hypothetical protein